jgi:sulfur transfer complex TusBCD TusB component (DsrH family)
MIHLQVTIAAKAPRTPRKRLLFVLRTNKAMYLLGDLGALAAIKMNRPKVSIKMNSQKIMLTELEQT